MTKCWPQIHPEIPQKLLWDTESVLGNGLISLQIETSWKHVVWLKDVWVQDPLQTSPTLLDITEPMLVSPEEVSQNIIFKDYFKASALQKNDNL